MTRSLRWRPPNRSVEQSDESLGYRQPEASASLLPVGEESLLEQRRQGRIEVRELHQAEHGFDDRRFGARLHEKRRYESKAIRNSRAHNLERRRFDCA